LIHYHHYQTFELCHIFKGSVGSLYVLILPCILVMRQSHRTRIQEWLCW
jgi:hypothetical protein